jgi:superoxide reductase
VSDEGKNMRRITVGSVLHPMTPEHFIEWVEVSTDQNERIAKFFTPGDVPEFKATTLGKITAIRAHCNLHGLWLTDIR